MPLYNNIYPQVKHKITKEQYVKMKSISQTAKVLMESASQPASVMVTYKLAHLIYIWSATVGVLLASRRTRFLVSIPLPDTNFPGCFDTFDICLSV